MATRATPLVTPQPNLKGILDRFDRFGSGSVRLRAATGYADIFGRTAIDLAANADLVGGQWVPLDRTQPSVLLQVIPGSGLVLYTAPATPAGPIPWAGPYTIGQAPTTDANGWRVAYLGDGKRLWTKRYTVTYRAMTADWVIPTSHSVGATEPLPAGLANQSQVDLHLSWRHDNGVVQGGWSVNMGVEGTDAATGWGVTAGTVDGANLSTKATGATVMVWAVER